LAITSQTAGATIRILRKREDDMRKALLIIGIIALVLGHLSVLVSLVCRLAYYGTLDGSSSMYASLRFDMKLYMALGIILLAGGTACLIIRLFVK